MTAAQYLAQMQRINASTSPHEKVGFESDLPTPYQTAEDYRRLSRARTDIERALRKTPRFRIVENLVFGSRETSLLNAHCSYIPESKEYLIVFNRGLLMSISAVTHLIVHALDLPSDRGRRVAEYQINRGKIRELRAHFFHVLDSTSRGRALDQNVAEPFRTEEIESKETEQTLIEDAAFDFVFAHEYAHIVCGHLAENETIRKHEISEYGRWGFEYQADTEALDLLGTAWVERFRRNPFIAVYIARGVCLFFAVLRRIEQYRAWVFGDSLMVWTPAHSHPPTFIRWLRLITQLEQRVPGPGWSEFLQAQLWSIDECVKAYFDASVPIAEHPRHAISTEQDAQQRIISSAGMFYALPQELLIALKVITTKPCAKTVPAIDLERAVQKVNDELIAMGVDPIRRIGENMIRMCHHLRSIESDIVTDVGEAGVAAIMDRVTDVVRHDALCRYGPAARANARRPIAKDTASVSMEPKPNSIRVACQRCGSSMYLDKWVLDAHGGSATIRCLHCLAVSDYRGNDS